MNRLQAIHPQSGLVGLSCGVVMGRQIHFSLILPEMQLRLIGLIRNECLALQTHSLRQVVEQPLLSRQHRQQEVQRIALRLQL